VPTNKQRRDSARRHLERQLQRRQERAARQRKVTLIASVAGTLVIIAVILVLVFALGGNDNKPSAQSHPGGNSKTSPHPSSPSPSPSPSPSTTPVGKPAACAQPAKGSTASYAGVSVKNATNLKKAPAVTAKVAAAPKALECMDLVVGKGQAATPTSTVSVQYVGALLKNGTVFDSSWARGGKPASFPLTGVIPGFTQGIGGTGKIVPMKVGGRRLIVMPAALGYPNGSGSTIPPGSALIFVVDLTDLGSSASSSSSGSGSTSPANSGAGSSKAGTVSCDWQTQAPASKKVDQPSTTVSSKGTVPVTVHTSQGDMSFTLDRSEAPCTVANFVSLVGQKYFDNTSCHRLVTSGIYVLQCGDPTGTGSGGPGYSIPDEATGSEQYPAGTIAMARSSQAHSGGSQFFIVYKDSPSLMQHLGKLQYTVFGTVAQGLNVVTKVAGAGTSNGSTDGPPKLPLKFTSMTTG
jgi:peptidyl-prolyl cis-trans isomerase B (cyclophilin B)